MSKVTSLFVFAILAISIFSFATPNSFVLADNVVLDQQNKLFVEKDLAEQIVYNHHLINLNESLNIKSNDQPNDNSKSSVIQNPKIISHIEINLSEKISISLEQFDDSLLGSLKHESERNAIMERVLDKSLQRITNLNSDKNKLSVINLEEAKLYLKSWPGLSSTNWIKSSDLFIIERICFTMVKLSTSLFAEIL